MDVFNLKELNFSIINPSDKNDSKDDVSPFSFLDFIKYLQTDYEPSKYSIFYSNYLKRWYALKDNNISKQQEDYNEFYKQFIQEIIINFTTETEKRFLSKIDYDNPVDLDIIIPFYANKLTEVATFYKNKREEGKYVIDRNKIKGSVVGIERAIFDNIYNYVTNSQDALLTVGSSLSSIVQDFNINIGEYVDIYGDYFDLSRPAFNESNTREDLYDNNLQEVDADYYFDPNALKVLRSNSFVKSIGNIKINPPAFDSTDISSICNPDDSIQEELNSTYTKGGLTLAEVYDLKRQLITKYVSSDFYFVSTTGVTPTSGLLFEADQPTNNLLNLQTADIAAVPSDEHKLLRDIGLFFKPDDIGMFKLNSGESRYEVDLTRLESDKVYIFPDPNIYGNIGTNAQSSYPLVHSFDFKGNLRNISSGVAVGDPKITNKSLTIEPYSTKQREIQELESLNTIGYKLNFSDLYNQGKIRKMGYDSFGNEYALFKPAELDDRTAESSDFISNKLLDGHTFFDAVFGEGYGFDYDTVACDIDTNTLRSGFTTFTSPPSASGWSFDYGLESPSFFNFRKLAPYEELSGERACSVDAYIRDGGLFSADTGGTSIVGSIKDGGGFTQGDGVPLPEPLKPGDIGYPGPGNYYYQTFVDCKTYIDDIRDVYSCGKYSDIIIAENQSNFSSDYEYYNIVDEQNRTILALNDSQPEPNTNIGRLLQTGTVFVKMQGSSLSYPLSGVLDNIIGKYNINIQQDVVFNTKDFDIIDDTLFLQTPNGLLIDKIKYGDDNTFEKPNTVNTFFAINSADSFNEVSNRLVVDSIEGGNPNSKVLFTVFKTIKTDNVEGKLLPRNYWYVYPEIYSYNQTTNKADRIYPQTFDQSDLASFSTSYDDDTFKPRTNFSPEKIKTPKLVYNSLNNKLKLTYVILDQNNMSHIHDCTFSWRGGILDLDNVIRYTPDKLSFRSTTFSNRDGYGSNFADYYKNSGGYEIVNNAFWIKGVPRSQLNTSVFGDEEVSRVFVDQQALETYYKPEYL